VISNDCFPLLALYWSELVKGGYVSWKMRKAVAADLRAVYAATTLEAARAALDEFEQQWGSDYPPIMQ